ncbi:MAG: hypothetical protein ABSG96_26955 [Terracidiphilus sp.]|jgi:hypothetical protein
MKRSGQSAAAVRFVVLVLCAALCAWGLQAKLSGYKASNQSHRKSVVKLIQDDETRRHAFSAPVAAPSPFLHFADPAAAYSQSQSFVDRIQLACKPEPDSAPSHTYALRFRPPPSTI